jgi:uncharacterized protein
MDTTDYKKYAWMTGSLALACVSFAAVATGLVELESLKHPNGQVASITVSGEGEVTAIPDIATVSFTVRESAKTVPEAQKLVEAKIAKALDAIAAKGVDKKDTKTLSYTVSPKYENQQSGYCSGYVCPPVKSILTGYEVAQSVSIKVRKVDTAGDVVGIIGGANITEVSGPDFTIDDKDKLEAEAKALAIKNAQAKAQATASSLDVSLGAITQFNEDNGGYYPALYRTEAVSMKAGGVADVSATLPQGENVIKSKVTITYTLK